MGVYQAIIRCLRRNKGLLYLCSFCYNIFFSPGLIQFYLTSQGSIKGSFLKHVRIRAKRGGKVYIGPRTMMDRSTIMVEGQNSILYIEGGGTNIHNSQFMANQPSGQIHIGEGFTCEGGIFRAHEGMSIKIGAECMFSTGIDLSTTDFHSIYDANTNERINSAKNIIIGNKVWLGRNTTVLKGARITNNVIVGLGSMVSGYLEEPNGIYAGVPAKKIKTNVIWSRPIV